MKKFFKIAGRIAGLLFLYSALQLVFTYIAIIIAMFVASLSGNVPIESLDLNLEVMQQMVKDGGYLTWSMAIALFLSAFFMLWFLIKFKFFVVRKETFTALNRESLLLSTALVFCSMFFLNAAVQLVNEYYPIPNLLEEEFAGLSRNVVGVLSITILAPILEEVLFRGAIQGYLMRCFKNPYVGIIIASLVFGVFHLNPNQVVYASLLGFILGWIYYRTRSLLPVIIGHILNNSLATLSMLLLGDAEEEILTSGGTSGLLSIVVLFALAALWLALRMNSFLPAVERPWREAGEPADDANG